MDVSMLDGTLSSEVFDSLRHPPSVSIFLPAELGGGGGACSQASGNVLLFLPD